MQKDHRVQPLAPQRTIQNSNPTSESSLQMLTELMQLGAMTTALRSMFYDHHPLVKKLFLNTQPDPFLMQLHAPPYTCSNCLLLF